MKHQKICRYCKSKKIQSLYGEGEGYRCLSCKRVTKDGQKKLTGEGTMTIMALVMLFMIIVTGFAQISKMLLGRKSYFLFLPMLTIFSYITSRFIIKTRTKYSK